MRWKFIESNDHREAAERQVVLEKIDDWWREFERRSGDIAAVFSGKSQFDLSNWMIGTLRTVAPGLMWEFGPAVRQTGHRLVITPESQRHMRPLVQTMLERAPKLDGWEFYSYRLSEDLDSTVSTVQGRAGVDIKEWGFRASIGELNQIDLVYTPLNDANLDSRSGSEAAFITTETLLGERCLDSWIGRIEFAPRRSRLGLKSLIPALFGRSTRPPQNPQPLERLRETVQALIGSIQDQLPREPHYSWVTEDGWSLCKLTPPDAEEYARQDDLFFATTPNQQMWTAAHSHAIFASERFSRCGETFCYLKFDSSDGFGRENLDERYRIADLLSGTLKQQQLGYCIGGGTGRMYAYIDLALTDVVKGANTIKHLLRKEPIPHRSWILFHDSELATEWIGIFENTPAPSLLVPFSPERE